MGIGTIDAGFIGAHAHPLAVQHGCEAMVSNIHIMNSEGLLRNGARTSPEQSAQTLNGRTAPNV